jgi:hypothetical protein
MYIGIGVLILAAIFGVYYYIKKKGEGEGSYKLAA